VDLINEVYETYNFVDIVDIVHGLPEHIDPDGRSLPLRSAGVLRVVGYPNDADERGRELEGVAHVHKVLGCQPTMGWLDRRSRAKNPDIENAYGLLRDYLSRSKNSTRGGGLQE
jgi:hypothetical protein